MSSKFRIHPILTFLLIISILTGTFIQLFILLSIVIIHELGHYLAAKWLKWDVSHMSFHIFGGVMQTDEWMKRPVHESLLVTLAGPLQHIWIYFLLLAIEQTALLPTSIILEIHYFNMILFLFNLLPIYPLDGGRLLFYILLLIFPYKMIYHFTIYSSFILLCIFISFYSYVFHFHLTVLLLSCFIAVEHYVLWRRRHFYFIRFLMSKLQVNKYKTLPLYLSGSEKINEMAGRLYKEKSSILHLGHKTMTEKQLIDAFFHPKWYHKTVGSYMEKK